MSDINLRTWCSETIVVGYVPEHSLCLVFLSHSLIELKSEKLWSWNGRAETGAGYTFPGRDKIVLMFPEHQSLLRDILNPVQEECREGWRRLTGGNGFPDFQELAEKYYASIEKKCISCVIANVAK